MTYMLLKSSTILKSRISTIYTDCPPNSKLIMTLKWGICCCGRISEDFTSAICEYETSRNKVVAVAARSGKNARLFSDKFKVDKFFDDYERLALCTDVDIVYVGAIDSEHCRLTKMFLNHGKHVLVEKSMGMNVAETKEMIELAREKKLFLMEGLWSLFFPIYKKISAATVDGTIGNVRHVNANFHYNLTNERIWDKDIGCGGLKALGIYAIQFALWVFRDRKLKNVFGNIKRTDLGIDMCGIIMMEFEGNGTAFVSYHASLHGDTSASLFGDKGSIVIPDQFWAPEVIIINGKEDRSLGTKRNNLDFVYNHKHSWGFTHEVNHVADCIERGLLESEFHPLSQSVQLAEIMENLLKEHN